MIYGVWFNTVNLCQTIHQAIRVWPWESSIFSGFGSLPTPKSWQGRCVRSGDGKSVTSWFSNTHPLVLPFQANSSPSYELTKLSNLANLSNNSNLLMSCWENPFPGKMLRVSCRPGAVWPTFGFRSSPTPRTPLQMWTLRWASSDKATGIHRDPQGTGHEVWNVQ